METSVLLALIGVLSGVIALLTAIARRKKVVENRYVTIVKNKTQKKHLSPNEKRWYDKHFKVFLAIWLFPPLGLYALVQSRTITTFWKILWFLVTAFYLIALLANTGK